MSPVSLQASDSGHRGVGRGSDDRSEPLLPGRMLEGRQNGEGGLDENHPSGDSPPHLTILHDEDWSSVVTTPSNNVEPGGGRYSGGLKDRQWLWLWQQRDLCGPSAAIEATDGRLLPLEAEGSELGSERSNVTQGDDVIPSASTLHGKLGETTDADHTIVSPFATIGHGHDDPGSSSLDQPEEQFTITRNEPRSGSLPLSSAVLASHDLRGQRIGRDAGGIGCTVLPRRASSPTTSSSIPSWSVPPRAREALCQAWGRRASRHPQLLERELCAMMVSAREASLYSESGGEKRGARASNSFDTGQGRVIKMVL